jgi:hypothetical protein
MKRIVFISILLGFLLVPVFCLSQSAKDTYKSLKRIEAALQGGVNFVDYSKLLREARFEQNIFLESAGGKKRVDLRNILQDILGMYESAKELWQELNDTANEEYREKMESSWATASEMLKKANRLMETK